MALFLAYIFFKSFSEYSKIKSVDFTTQFILFNRFFNFRITYRIGQYIASVLSIVPKQELRYRNAVLILSKWPWETVFISDLISHWNEINWNNDMFMHKKITSTLNNKHFKSLHSHIGANCMLFKNVNTQYPFLTYLYIV